MDRTGDYAQAIVKSLSEAILTADDEGRFIDANEGAVALFGVSQEHLTGRGVADFTAEGFDFQPAWKEFRRQGTFRGEVPLRRPDGTVRYVDCSATADFLPGQHLLVLRDLTSRRLAERRLQAQYSVTRLLAASPGLEEAAARVLEAVCDSLGCDVSAFWTVDEAAGLLHCLESRRAPDATQTEFEEHTRKSVFAKGSGLPGRVWETGRPAWIDDIASDRNFPRGPLALAAGLQSAFAFPIVLAGETVGVMEFFASERREPDEALMEALAAVGSQLGQFIERKRAEHQLETRLRQLQAVYRIFGAVAMASGPDEVYDVALDAILSGLRVDRASLLLYDPDGVMRFKAWRGLSDDYRAATIGHSPWTRDAVNPQPVVVGDVPNDASLTPLLPVIEAEGIRALAFVPLVHQGQLLGKFMLYFDSPHDFSPEELQLAQTIGGTIAFAISRSQSEAALRKSQKQMSAILDTAVDGIITIDESGAIQSVNPAACRLFGYASANLIGRNIKTLMPEPYVTEHDSYVGNYLATGKKKVIGIGREVMGRRKDGTTFPMDLSVSEVELDGRRLFTGIVRDITQRKQADAEVDRLLTEVELERRRLDAVVSDVPGVVWEAWGEPDKANQRIDYVSERVEEMLGYTRADWLSGPNFWLEIVHPDDKQRAAAEAAAIFEAGGDGISQFRWIAKDGRTLWMEARSRVILDQQGRPAGMRGVTTDITDRHLAEDRESFLAEAGAILASSLDYEETLTGVARLSAGRIADLCSVDLVRGGDVYRVAVAHVDPDKERPFAAMGKDYTPSPGKDHPVLRVAKSRQAELHSDIAVDMYRQAARDEKHFNLLQSLGVKSMIVVPLVAHGEGLGTITLVRTTHHIPYTAADMDFAQELARRAGIAIENAKLYEAEQEARRRAEEANETVRGLHSLTEAALRHLDLDELMHELLKRVHKMLEVDTSNILLLSEGGRQLTVRATVGIREEKESGFTVPFGEGFSGTIAKTRRPLVLEDTSRLRILSPILAHQTASLMGVPLIAEGRLLGVLHVGTTHARTFGDDELRLLQLIGDRIALAIEHARLYDAERQTRRAAEDAVGRTERLQSVTAALSEAVTLSQVGDIVLEAASEALSARSGLVVLLAANGSGFETVAALNTMPQSAGAWMEFLANPPTAVLESAAGGKSLFAGSNEELVQSFPELAALPLPEGRSFASTPLMIESRAIGSLVLTFSPGRSLSGEDRELLLALARLCAQAVERARLYEAEQEARNLAEGAEERTRRLQAITASLSRALSPDEVVAEVVDQCMTAFGAQSSTVARLIDDGRTFQLLRYAGSEDEISRQWRTWPADMHTPMSEAIRTMSPIFLESREEILARFPALQERTVTSQESSVCIPLLFEGGAIGAMSMGFRDRRRFSEDDADFLMALGRQCAQALERTRLYEAERKARSEAEAAQQKQAFLAEASAILASSLDYETTLASVAHLCVPYLGDWCIIDTVEDDGALHRVSLVHGDPEKVRFAQELESRYPPDLRRNPEMLELLQSGKPRFYPEIPDEALARGTQDADQVSLLKALGLKSGISVPMLARGRTVGVLTVITAESGRTYTRKDLELALDLGHRAGLAVDNARLFSESQEIQQQLRVANEAKDEFLGLVSHELRTPITTIYGGARLLRSRGDRLDGEGKESIISDIEHESERLNRIVEDLLVLARMELGQEVATEPVLVQRVVEKAAAALLKRRPSRRVELRVPKDLVPTAASPVYLEQILRNLLSNADKYGPAGGLIEVSAKQTGEDEIQIAVRDQGPGIPADEVDLVFERFYRSDKTSRQAGGAGIGLTVCKRLIEAQGGSIWARNAASGGLVVTFSLPVYKE